MKNERGFTAIELLVALTITVFLGGTVTAAIWRTALTTEASNNHMAAVQQVQNAGYWITRDAQMAETVIVDNSTPTDWLIMTWPEWDYGGNNTVIHWAVYSFDNVSSGIGIIRRNYWSSAGATSQTLVAKNIYYSLSDPANTSEGSYTYPDLDFRLVSRFDDASETREFKVSIRPNLY
ncbi:MAG: prepilin-type N-terminal cleavage/methylation domain-containing protein [Chloroflexi bacterium]|nr:prepilin-type N-terminal cleavage/methylation domain-containing protein [Chloroflexota bacterium]